jgi:predicted phosphodiesterase
MARIALISDIHANLEALEAVLEDVESMRPTLVVSLGDVVGYGPDPAPCVELVYESCDVAIVGNHDEAAVSEEAPVGFNDAALQSLLHTRETLTTLQKSAIRSWEHRRLIEGVAITHGSFGRRRYAYANTQPVVAECFGAMGARTGVVGHTHVPAAFVCPEPFRTAGQVFALQLGPDVPIRLEEKHRHLLNPGSVGQPRDRNPDAAWALLDTDAATFHVRRVAYEVALTQWKIRRAGLPDFLGERLRVGA